MSEVMASRCCLNDQTVLSGQGAMVVQPAVPGLHKTLSLVSGVLVQVQHPPWPASARAALAVRIEHALALKEIDRLMQHCLGQPQLRMIGLQAMEESGGVAVVLQKAGQNPADGQLEIKEQWGWLLEVMLDVCKAGARGLPLSEHENPLSQLCLASSHSDFQASR